MELYLWKEVKSAVVNTSLTKFWQSSEILISKPSGVSKRIAGVDVFLLGSCTSHFHLNQFLKRFLSSLCISSVISKEYIISVIERLEVKETSSIYEVLIRFLYPKTGVFLIHNMDIVIKDLNKNMIVFFKPFPEEGKFSLTPKFPYSIMLEGNLLKLFVENVLEEEDITFLCNLLLPKLRNWIEADLQNLQMQSHILIPREKFILKYCELKKKYSKAILEIWSECTDPQKFVYEDIAIATYLILLWGEKPKRFIDIGCGNGLLVYILISENHVGLGIDVRSRNIWTKYPSNIILKEFAIVPSLDFELPESDWIIGNHPDEMTPWIPVLTALNLYTANFFLLPCCPYDFNGRKYARNNSSKSHYLDYIDYVESICDICGFFVEKDRLKIPSTKRICLVSKGRSYKKSEKCIHFEKIKLLINSKIIDEEPVKIRDAKERVRNCTQINKETINSIINCVTQFLLNGANHCESTWREGKCVNIKELINILPNKKLQELKNEHGGFQTLLKNHQDIFSINNGFIKLKKPFLRNPGPKVWKKKPCWFFLNHPDSCPLKDEDCSYIHYGKVQ